MLYIRYIFIISFTYVFAFAEDNIQNLLTNYQNEAELSNTTKLESAGFIDIFTRDELERMQAHTLEDVLKTLPNIYLTRKASNFTTFSKSSVGNIPSSMVRLYINDHDMSSASTGSAFMVWSKMPIEYIDHIEIYRASSSIEFGNETASLIIKLYTKTANRDQGSKIRTMVDQTGSTNLDAYTAQTINDDFSLFAYANLTNMNRDSYKNSYKGESYDINSDYESHNIFINLLYKDWKIDLGHYKKKEDLFLGMFAPYTPKDGGLDAKHTYLHVTKNFINNFKLQLSYDKISYDYQYKNYYFDSDTYDKDDILSVILEKTFFIDKHKLLLGGFYKSKSVHEDSSLQSSRANTPYVNSYSNTLHLSSLYIEENYRYDETTLFVLTLKGESYQYKKAVKSQKEYVIRAGLIKKIQKFQIKAFGLRSYIPLAFYQVYNNKNRYHKTNPNLNSPKIDTLSASISYLENTYKLEFIIQHTILKDNVAYNPQSTYGYFNVDQTLKNTQYRLKYDYIFNVNNKIYVDLYYGTNAQDINYSPKYGINLRFFNRYQKFDFYNEFIYRDAYAYEGVNVESSLDFTASIKYHINKDLLVGIRGENIFNHAYEQAYKGLDYSIPVTDQKFWLNIEYTF